MYSDSEDETGRRQIREDYEERQEEVNYGLTPGNYPIVIQRGKAPVLRLSRWKRLRSAFLIAIGR